MSAVRYSLLLVVLLVLAGPAGSRATTSEMLIESAEDTVYLPYTVTWTQGPYPVKTDIRLFRPYQVFEEERAGTGAVMQAYYHLPISEQITVFSLRYWPINDDDDNLVDLVVNDWRIYKDESLERGAVAGAGYSGDSAIAFRLLPETGEYIELPLFAVQEGTGDGSWHPQISVELFDDYDFDQRHEMFVYLNSELEGTPRILFCIEMETLVLEWQLPVASLVKSDWIFPCGDSVSPQVMFVTYNPKQGLRDSNFTDAKSYLVKVDNYGNILHKQVVAEDTRGQGLVPAFQRNQFFLCAETACFPEYTEHDSSDQQYGIYLIDSRATVLCAAETPGIPSSLWTQPWGPNGNERLFVKMSDGRLCVYDDELNLLSESLSTDLDKYFGEVRLFGQDKNCFVYQNGIYTQKLEQLLAFPFSISYLQPYARDKAGNLTAFVAGNINRGILGRIVKRSFKESMTIFYMKNRTYIFILLGFLVLLLLIVNHYRLKTKGNLKLIADQKRMLEKSQAELTASNAEIREAYQKLETATEEIATRRAREAAAEQYRVASGQFRHEINNALGAVKIALSGIVKSETAEGGNELSSRYDRLEAALTYLFDRPPDVNEKLRSRTIAELQEVKRRYQDITSSLRSPVLAGVDRCLRLAEKLRTYESIDRDETSERVDLGSLVREVIESRQTTITKKSIELKLEVSVPSSMVASRDLLYVMILNLLENSIDALAAKPEDQREIHVELKHGDKGEIKLKWYDSGVGIKPEKYEKIFQPFYSEKPTSGSGLGLSMVRSVAEKYGGQIRIESEMGRFTSFLIDFPGR